MHLPHGYERANSATRFLANCFSVWEGVGPIVVARVCSIAHVVLAGDVGENETPSIN